MLDLPSLPTASVVVLQADTLRADRLSLYGSDRETVDASPGWLVVNGYHATSSWTVPTTASVLTGQEPQRHGMVLGDKVLGADEGTLAEVFQNQGYATALFSGNAWVGSASGLQKGFDEEVLLAKDFETSNAGVLVDAALPWVETLPAEQPFFLFLQPMDAHTPYSPDTLDQGTFADPEALPFNYREFASEQDPALAAAMAEAGTDEKLALTAEMEGVYDEEILGINRALSNLIASLEVAGRDDVIVVLTSDHGETLNDAGDGVFGHGNSLRPELVEIPFAIHHPAIPAGEAVCAGLGTDLLPTLMNVVGVDVPEGIDGQVLQAGCREVVRSSLTNQHGELMTLSAENSKYRLTRSCITGFQDATDLGTGASGDGVQIDADALQTLEAAIDEMLKDYENVLEVATCASGPTP